MHLTIRARLACAALCLSLSPVLTPTLTAVAAAGVVQEGGITSKLAGARVPFRPEPVENAALSGSMGRFLAEFAKEKKQTPGDGPAEVFFWTGDSYKEGRAPAVRTAFKKSLTAAGYTVTEYVKDEVYASPFGEEIGLSADEGQGTLHLSPWDQQVVFVATNPKAGRSLVGVWFDQKSKSRLVLGIAATGFVAPKKEAPLPDVPPGALLVKDMRDAMRGQPAPPLPSFPKMTAKPGRMRGMVKDGSGKPLAGAKILTEMSAVGGFKTSASGTTDANGVYDFAIPAGAGRIVMTGYTARYNGRSYGLPLHPADGQCEDFSSANGHVENFVLRNYGVADPDRAEEEPNYFGNYYGGGISVYWLVDDIPQGGTMEIILTPKAPLLDGSKGRTLVYRIPNDQHGGNLMLNDIPIGRYVMTAQLWEDGEALPVQIMNRKERSEYSESLTVDFTPKKSDLTWAKSCGVERFDVSFKL
jgi:hypothetical protein